MMRMGADRAMDIRKLLRDCEQLCLLPHPSRYRHHAANPRRFRARNNSVEIIGEIGKIQMAVTVDKHQRLTVQAADGST
jgi:hypothetical protein